MFDAVPFTDSTPLQQSAGFARALDATGRDYLELADGTLALQRRFGPVPVTMLARTRMVDPRNTIALLKSEGVRGPVILSPDRLVDLSEIGAVPLVSPATLASLNLSLSLEKLQARQHQKWRNRLRHAEKQDLKITRQNMPTDPDHWLLQSDRFQQAKRGYRNWPMALTLAFARENKGQAKLFTAFQGTHPVAGMLILRHGDGASYHISHTTPLGRTLSAHTLLLWHAVRYLKSKGHTEFDLGYVDTESAPGLARFKLGSGARTRMLGGTWLWWPPITKPLQRFARLDRALMNSR